MEKLIIFTDGGARGNPGPAGAGAVVMEGDTVVMEVKKYLGERQTNNWAEYEAVSLVLRELIEKGFAGRPIEVRMDSMLVVEQIMGRWKIKEPTLKPQAAQVHALLRHFGDYVFVHIPRAKNSEADRLVNEAIDAALGIA